jgi:hypothetical protein
MQRCKAKSKRSGEQCKNFAIKKFGVCRMHGAFGGPKTPEGIVKCKKGPLKHGFYAPGAQEELRMLRELAKRDYYRISHDDPIANKVT